MIPTPLTPALIAAMVFLSPSSSVSGPVFDVVCEGALPFSRSELEAALRPRSRLLGPAADGPSVRRVLVRALGNGMVGIEVGSGKREVQLQGATGEAAARVVALLTVETSAETTAHAAAPPASRAPRAWEALTVSAQMLVPFVADGWTATAEPTLVVGVPVWARIGVGFSVGTSSVFAYGQRAALQLRQIPVRGGVGYAATPWLDVQLSGVARSYAVSGGGSDTGVHWGATASVTAYRQITDHVAVAVSAGVDGMRNRTEFRVDDRPQLTTNWLVPWVGAGLALRRARP